MAREDSALGPQSLLGSCTWDVFLLLAGPSQVAAPRRALEARSAAPGADEGRPGPTGFPAAPESPRSHQHPQLCSSPSRWPLPHCSGDWSSRYRGPGGATLQWASTGSQPPPGCPHRSLWPRFPQAQHAELDNVLPAALRETFQTANLSNPRCVREEAPGAGAAGERKRCQSPVSFPGTPSPGQLPSLLRTTQAMQRARRSQELTSRGRPQWRTKKNVENP